MQHLFSRFKDLPVWATLTQGQRDFCEAFFAGSNLFLSGPAGTGKSFVITTLRDFLRKEKRMMAVTASTGVAAFNLGGQTLHSWAGVGLAQESAKHLIEAIKKNGKARKRMKDSDVLVIDEVSMIKGDFLDKIDLILKYFRFSNRPFGGIQIIFCGDHLQLAPVWRNDEVKLYSFESRSWQEAAPKVIELTEIMRQVGDKPFATLLNELRVGNVTNIGMLKQCVRPIPKDLKPIEIYCRNVDVERINAQRLAQIQAPSKTYRSRDNGLPHHIDQFNKNCPAPSALELKPGAQVMLLSNLDTEAGFVNGSIGTVKGFSTEGVIVKFKAGTMIVAENTWEIKEEEAMITGEIRFKVVASRIQIPLKVAYASSVHKSQSATFDCAYLDIGEAFACGQAYCALSRVRSLDSLYLADFSASKVKVDQKALDFYTSLRNS